MENQLSETEREVQIRFCKENTDCGKINFDKMSDLVLMQFTEAISDIGRSKQIVEGWKKLING